MFNFFHIFSISSLFFSSFSLNFEPSPLDLLALNEWSQITFNLTNSKYSNISDCFLTSFGSNWGKHFLCDFSIEKMNILFSSPLSHQKRNQKKKELYGYKQSIISSSESSRRSLRSSSSTIHRSIQSSPKFHSHTHHLPHSSLDNLCYFLSFGVANDYSFETSLHNLKNCSGISLDPSVDHPIHITPGVIFLKTGANTLFPLPNGWTSWSVPAFRKWYGHYLYVLKMDCEGCEYALARDILQDDPSFFHYILQFSIEIHTPKTFMQSYNDIYLLGRLYRLLQEAGLQLVHVDSGSCHPKLEREGCFNLLAETGFLCNPGCRSYLFARIE